MRSSPWLKHGFWNTLEHGITRFSDAATTLVLLWVLPTEVFSKLALAQATVALFLLFFLAPESVFYRDFVKWKALGINALLTRLQTFRFFAWSKGLLAVLISALVAFVVSDGQSRYLRFWALIWAFATALAPQISGPDREFLRLNLKLRELNIISLYQKSLLLLGTLVVGFLFFGNIPLLASFAVFTAISTAFLAKIYAERILKKESAEGFKGVQKLKVKNQFQILKESLGSFSIWNHLWGVVFGWTQTMDLFVLGLLRYPAQDVGLYAVVLKLANFSMTLPVALTNLFSVWIGRRSTYQDEDSVVGKFSWSVFGVSFVQAVVLAGVAPWGLSFLSHGRWSLADQERMLVWLYWILIGSVIVGSSFLLNSWLTLRGRIDRLFKNVYLPWGIFAFLLYFLAGWLGNLEWVARINLCVGILYGLLLMNFKRSEVFQLAQ